MRRLGTGALCALLALVVLTGVARAGTSYLYCPSMDELRSSCCCAETRDVSAVPQFEVERMRCCKPGAFAAMPAGTTTAAPLAVAAPLAAILPVRSFVFAPTEVPPHHFMPTGRTGPPTSLPSRASLMVFLI